MPLWKLREQRKRLGPGTRRGPRTAVLIALLVLVLAVIWALDALAG